MKNILNRRSWLSGVTAVALTALTLTFGLPDSAAKPTKVKGPKTNNLNITPTLTSLNVVNGQLLASGNVTVTVKNQTVTEEFTDIPVTLALSDDQTGAGVCPILDLALGPIELDLLGLVVETSPICLEINAYENGGLLGDLLCGVAGLLDGGLDLGQILDGVGLTDPLTGETLLPGLTDAQLDDLLSGVTDLLNQALGELLGAILIDLIELDQKQTCAILHLELGPLNLNLLGLEVILDDCAGGPVVVDITAQEGPGNLLGNLLCELVDGGLLEELTTTLQDILDQLTGLLNN